HPFVEQVDRLALARAVDAADQHHHRERFLGEQLVLRGEQRLAQRRDLPGVTFLVDGVTELGRFEHAALVYLSARRASSRACRKSSSRGTMGGSSSSSLQRSST